MQTCYICQKPYPQLHSHHIHPTGYGGDPDGQQIPLCGTCHTALHSMLAALLSKDQRKRLKRFFPPEQMERAGKLAQAMAFAKRNWEDANKPGEQVLQLKLNRKIVTRLHILKRDRGFTNLQTFCEALLTEWVQKNFK